MKSFGWTLAVSIGLGCLGTAAVATVPLAASAANKTADKKSNQKTAMEFVEKELLVKFKLGKNEKGNAEIKKIGAKVLEKLSKIDISRLSLPKGMTVERAVEVLSKLNIVEFAEPNYIQHTTSGPNDPKYDEQWGLKTIRAYSGWGIHTGRSNTVIAIVDTGVDLNHPDLKNKLVKGYNFVEDNDTPMDDDSHGTHCAGIAAASTNNGVGVAGVCPNCSVMPVRVLGSDGSGTTSTVSNGIIYAADHGAAVISMSLGSPSASSTLDDAVKYAAKKGVVIVAAAGNDGVDLPFYPAYLEPCIAVGSTVQYTDERSSFSNYGDWVDIAAPGSSIMSTIPGNYGLKSGTSMAAPFVSGLAALMVSCSHASPDKIRKAMTGSAVPVGDWVSSGRIDVPKALEAIGCSAPSSNKTPSGGTSSGNTPSGNPPSGNPPSGNPPSGNTSSGKTPTNETKEGAVVSYKIQQGRSIKEPKDSLITSDDQRLGLGSKGSGMSTVLDLNMTAKLKGKTTYTSLKLEMEGASEGAGNFKVSLLNASSSQWIEVGTVYLKESDTKVAVDVSSGATYVAKTGEVQIRLYRSEKLWNGFEVGIDWVKVSGVEQKAAPDNSGNSSSGKAKGVLDAIKGKL
jgi:thermitase